MIAAWRGPDTLCTGHDTGTEDWRAPGPWAQPALHTGGESHGQGSPFPSFLAASLLLGLLHSVGERYKGAARAMACLSFHRSRCVANALPCSLETVRGGSGQSLGVVSASVCPAPSQIGSHRELGVPRLQRRNDWPRITLRPRMDSLSDLSCLTLSPNQECLKKVTGDSKRRSPGGAYPPLSPHFRAVSFQVPWLGSTVWAPALRSVAPVGWGGVLRAWEAVTGTRVWLMGHRSLLFGKRGLPRIPRADTLFPTTGSECWCCFGGVWKKERTSNEVLADAKHRHTPTYARTLTTSGH